jgi:hypothetical protein
MIEVGRTNPVNDGTGRVDEVGPGDTGEPESTFTFRIMVDGIEPGSPAEKESAQRMEADYLGAVRTTLKGRKGSRRPPRRRLAVRWTAVADGFTRRAFALADAAGPSRL